MAWKSTTDLVWPELELGILLENGVWLKSKLGSCVSRGISTCAPFEIQNPRPPVPSCLTFWRSVCFEISDHNLHVLKYGFYFSLLALKGHSSSHVPKNQVQMACFLLFFPHLPQGKACIVDFYLECLRGLRKPSKGVGDLYLQMIPHSLFSAFE